MKILALVFAAMLLLAWGCSDKDDTDVDAGVPDAEVVEVDGGVDPVDAGPDPDLGEPEEDGAVADGAEEVPEG